MLHSISKVKRQINPNLKIEGVLMTMVDSRTNNANLYSVREFGNDCLLYTLDELLRYGDFLNIIQADERNRVVERKDVPLFDDKAFREAIINAILHNA